MTALSTRYDFALLFDVTDGNPNGDPDANNQPRVDPETGHGLVTDVALKRLVRDYVSLTRRDDESAGHEIYVKERGTLATEQRRAYEAVGLKSGSDRPNARAREWMCRQFWDVRTFGAVMTMGRAGKTDRLGDVFWNCGQVRGPVQLTFARSLDPILVMDNTITRVAATNAGSAGSDDGARSKQLGRKYTVPYALYRAHGFVSPQLARATELSESDLELLWEALLSMFDHVRSANRGMMSTVALVVFEHQSALGDAPAARLFERLRVTPRATPARTADDYDLLLDGAPLQTRAKVVRPART